MSHISKLIYLIVLVIISHTANLCSSAETTHSEPNQPAYLKVVPPEKLKEDLDFLFKTIEEVHPNMYAYISKEEFGPLREQLYKNINQPMTRLNFLKLTAPIVASLKNPHTIVTLPLPPDAGEFTDYLQYGGKIFPLSLRWDGEKAILDRNYTSKQLPLGGTLLKVNGEDTSKMIYRLCRYISTEGRGANPSVLERDKILRFLFWLEYGEVESLDVQIKAIDGTVNDYAVEMMTFNQIRQKEDPNSGKNSCVYLLAYDAFFVRLNDWADWGRIKEFTEFCDMAFTQIRDKGTPCLIIDLRNNPGGDYWNVEVFYTYLLNQSHSFFHGANPLRFDGMVYLLIGTNSTSASTSFAATIKEKRQITIIGQEPMEPLQYYGSTTYFELPNTHLKLQVPRELIVLPGNKKDGRGVLPDYEVKQKPQDTAKGVDTVLQFTLNLIKDSD